VTSDKEIAIEAIKGLSDDATLEEIAEEIGVLAAIRKGEQDAGAGRMVSHEDVKGRFRTSMTRRGSD
jgi:predicted transcriptional regulator